MPLRPRGSGEHDRGAVALIVAFMVVVMAGLAALVVDLGFARDENRTAQNAADAAALGAASALATAVDPSAVTAADIARARTLADGYAHGNGWSAGVATFTVDPVAAVVTVAVTPVQAPVMFAGVIGSSTPTVGASARATWRGAPTGCSICVLGNLSTQNGQVLTTAGSVLVGGALSVGPNGTVSATSGIVGVVGAATVTGGGSVTPAATPIPALTDPYGTTPTLPPPAPALGARARLAAGPGCSPGTYSDITACRTFASGIYVITGQNNVSGNITVDASAGVLFYVTCSSGQRRAPVSAACAAGQAGGSLVFAGTVNGTITALPDPAYRGIAIAYDRANTADLGLVGAPGLTVNGNVYARSARLVNSGTGPLTIGGTLVIGSVDLHGVPSTINVTGASAVAGLGPTLVHLVP